MSSVAALLDDAEKIAEELCPPVAAVPRVLGVLIKQVEKIAGAQLVPLIEQDLGLTPPAAPAASTPAETAYPAQLAALQAEIDALNVPAASATPKTVAELEAELAAAKAAAAGGGA
jgi:hypothetical protein